MKTTKKKTTELIPAAASEECGVWLDATELRAKKKQKRLVRPISKVLNPLARSGGYSMAVALSFTQTKMNMPATKQSTISAFFLPQSKMSKDTEERSSSLPSEISSTLLPEPHMGTKRKRAMTTELQETSNITSHTSQVHPQEIDADLEKDFQCQENLRACAVMHKNTCSQRPVLTTRSGTEKQHTAKHTQNPRKELEISMQKHNNTQRSHVKRKDKENIGPTSPTHNTDVPPVNQLLSPSPAKRFSNFEKPSVFQRVRLYPSPKKSAKKSLENKQDSFAMLFTQDSEGFRVIANSSQHTRSVLKDRTNSTEDRENWNLPPVKTLEMEEDSQVEPEVLFTQDSQGNMVIRH
ncbi:hypothetical protein MHYP_G00340780 [Metynnis hypsauchen]